MDRQVMENVIGSDMHFQPEKADGWCQQIMIIV